MKFVRMISKVGGQKSTRLGSSSSSFQQTHCIVVCPVDRGSRSPVLDLDDDKSYCFPTLENGVSFSAALQKPHKSYVPWNDYYCLLAFCGTKGTIYWWTKVEIGFCPVADTSPNVDFQDTLQLIVSEKTFDLKKKIIDFQSYQAKLTKSIKKESLTFWDRLKVGKMKVFSPATAVVCSLFVAP